jgi:hypothetical protein
MAITSIKTGSSFTNLQKYNDFLAGNAAYNPSSFESIATVTVGAGGASSISFSSIPATYQHLQIRYFGRNTTDNNAAVYMTTNGDTGSNYSWHQVFGSGSSAGTQAFASQTYMSVGQESSTSNVFDAHIVDLLDYANTNKNKTVRTLGGWEDNTQGRVFLRSGLWMNTAAISSITLTPSSSNFAQYSSFALYGIKG